MPIDVKWLRPEEELDGLSESECAEMAIFLQKRLARRAELLKKHEWGGKIRVRRPNYDAVHACCLECGYERVAHRGKHAPGCAWAAEIEGRPRGAKDDAGKPE